ncbi:MAG: hypothetical protein SOV43_03895 [Selenomonadaceae bacterium]|nr:hypothetical protein [Selenomonadaceae bacterium]MDY2685297.1 hypothetical protein [Selenomonadaceae bacterium]
MSDSKNTQSTGDAAKDASVLRPHGEQQNIKMEILDRIHSGENPFDILYHVAKYLEDVSGEPGYAKYVEDQIRSIYGCALQHEKPLQNELAEVEARLKRIEASYENPVFTEEEHIRIGFAIEKHKKNIERLRTLIHEAKANHTSMNLKKD